MRLAEIQSKDDFHKKLKYPMELVNGIRQEVDEIMAGFNRNGSIEATMEEEFGDDYVAWTFEIKYNPEWPNDLMFEIIDGRAKNYRTMGNVSLHAQILNNKTPGYNLIGLQLDV